MTAVNTKKYVSGGNQLNSKRNVKLILPVSFSGTLQVNYQGQKNTEPKVSSE